MARSTSGELFEKNNKVILESKKNFLYERFVYIIYPKLVYMIEAKLLESSKFLEDSIVHKTISEDNYMISTELYAAPRQWIDDNNFAVFDGKSKTIKKKKPRQLVKFAK